jgi:hypothetical protein
MVSKLWFFITHGNAPPDREDIALDEPSACLTLIPKLKGRLAVILERNYPKGSGTSASDAITGEDKRSTEVSVENAWMGVTDRRKTRPIVRTSGNKIPYPFRTSGARAPSPPQIMGSARSPRSPSASRSHEKLPSLCSRTMQWMFWDSSRPDLHQVRSLLHSFRVIVFAFEWV